jgi:hypothetical protein
MTMSKDLKEIPKEFTLIPFWFWNDELDERELLRQIDDFEKHGVYGFVIHPRVGLPRDTGWMSEKLLGFMHVAIDEAERRGMKVILYDEGMYPSGSSSGQVVAADPSLACRCLAIGDESQGEVVARVKRANGQTVTIVNRKADSVIRGLHYIDEAKATEDLPPAGDILNPKTAAKVIALVYDKFYQHFGGHFGKTIIGCFTDEPNPLGRLREKNVKAGTTGIVQYVSEKLGYDFTPHLPALWFDDEPDAAKHRAAYDWAIHRRLEETWFRPLSQWCDAHGVALCGHPDRGDEIGVQKLFQYPGQDLVWRWVLPDHPTALEGRESTQGKCSSSAMIHLGRRRNSNEFCGAYGSETTWDEFIWLANWCLVRGVNLLIPHAFYYSVRGPRKDERPPQVGGVGCSWWDQFKPFADHCRRLSWLNTDSQHVCRVAIMAPPDACPWRAAKVCFENQIDFNYLCVDHLGHVPIRYDAYIIDGEIENMPAELQPTFRYDRDEAKLLAFLRERAASDVKLDAPAKGLRVRHVIKEGEHFYMLFNECRQMIDVGMDVAASGEVAWINTATGEVVNASRPVQLKLEGHEMKLLRIVST